MHSLKTIAAAVGVIFCSIVFSCAQTALPDDISITPPGPEVATNLTAFSGAWLGSWDGELSAGLVVERIRPNGRARVIYSWGDSKWRGIEADWDRRDGKIAGNKLHVSFKDGPTIDFTLEKNGKLSARYQLADEHPLFGDFERVPGTNVAVILAAAKKPVVPWEEIRIPVHSQIAPTRGKTFQLQTTVYRQDASGKHPVVIYSHGSTGPGLVAKEYVFRSGNEASCFRALGYTVVAPMRKGRGRSEGPYLEEDWKTSNSVGLDSAIEDLNAVVEFERRQSDVETNRIVVAGISRGGFLSVVYAGRYPTNVAGVVNFSGGWFGEKTWSTGFNFEGFEKAGHDAKVPMLWLYADHDSFYSLKFVEREFAKFQAAGGRGGLFEVRDIPGEGHLLCMWVDRWRSKVTSYLKGL